MSKTFTMNAVHPHYTCKCESRLPNIVLKEETGEITITVKRKCQKCKKGKIIDLAIGGMSSDVPDCVPGCTCQEMMIRLTKPQFVSFIRKGRCH